MILKPRIARQNAATKADEVLELCQAGVEANRRTPIRQGNLLVLGAESGDDVLISADLHGHRENFQQILQAADLERNPRRHLVLQEVCHGGPTYDGNACRSHEMLEEVVRLKVRHPDRVHFLLSNHELSEQTMHPISKDGKILLLAFRLGLATAYGDRGEEVHAALARFIASCPLAMRVGEAFVCHSAPERMDELGFDPSVFERPLEPDDVLPGGSVFRMVWGRDYREENARAFADRVGADVLVHGHTPCAAGFNTPNGVQLILDCSAEPAAYALVSSRGRKSLESIGRGVKVFDSSSSGAALPRSNPTSAPTWNQSDAGTSGISESLDACMRLEGALGVALVDSASGKCLCAAGGMIEMEAAAAGIADLVRIMRRSLRAAGADGLEDILLSTDQQYELVRAAAHDPNLILYFVLRRSCTVLAIARRKLEEAEVELRDRLTATIDLPQPHAMVKSDALQE